LASDERHDMQDTSLAWPELVSRAGGELRLIAAFALCYVPLVWLGYQFKTSVGQLTVMWPAVGLLLAALILAPLRRWPVLIAVQLAAEYTVAWLADEPSMPVGVLLFMIANTSDAVVGALITRSHLWRFNLVRVALALQFLLASCAGAAVGASLGAAFTLLNYGHGVYWEQWQLWWAGNWLGTLVIAPPVLFWALPVRREYASLRRVRYWEVVVLGTVLAFGTWLLFRAPLTQVDSLLRTPAVLLAVLLVIAFRLPPRWSSLLAMGAAMMGAALGASYPEYIIGDQSIARMMVLQTYLILMAALPLIIGMLVTSMRVALDQVSESESRYRTFIELSSEAVWRVEIKPPMPVDLPLEEQKQWLRAHARVAESNATFDRFSAGCTEPVPHTPAWEPQRSWCALYERHLDAAAANGYSLDDLRLVAEIEGRARTFITSFSGVVVDGELRRIWCVGRDVSEIVDLNTRLLRERERLKAYAHQLVTAEERARRATAVDLHDGIGQSLTGMAMSLEVARMQAPEVAPLLDDIRANLRRVQERTRSMIADLSPPGLYDLGLAPALQWLVVHFRKEDELRVQLHCDVKEDAIGMDLRVLIFKLVRELLRNVVKHAGVDVARVNVRGDTQTVQVEVTDNGRGFEYQMEMFGPNPATFGLWSISDRVADFGGTFSVDTSPGRGARFTLEFPLNR
jgi:signal transduction histidine kinase